MGANLVQSSTRTTKHGPNSYEFVIDESNVGDEHPKQLGARRFSKATKEQKLMYRMFVATLSILCVLVLGAIAFANSGKKESKEATIAAHTGSTYDSGFNMKQNWGAYSPYFDSGKPFTGIDEGALSGEYTLPDQCRYKQVHVLHRHGDRYPSGGTSDLMERVSKKLKAMKADPPEQLAWLKDWTYTLGSEQLVAKGVATMFSSGSQFWSSHGRLLFNVPGQLSWSDSINKDADGNQLRKPLLRTTSQDRMFDSAQAWAAGFFGTYGHPSSGVDPRDHYQLVVQPEIAGQNNSLASYEGCPNAEKKGATSGSERKKKWVDLYLEDATTRLQGLLPDYDSLTAEEVLGFQDLCVFETAAYGSSAFCELFTETEWRGFEYHTDLKFYGDFAGGSHVGPAEGLTWLQELYARLTNTYITSSVNGVNVTYTENEDNFPLGLPFYADFTHDSIIASVLSALQFEFTKTDLSPKKIKVPRQFVVSRLTPFGARMYVEILECGEDEYVRIKLNDRVLNLNDLKHCPASSDGLCPKKNFISSLAWCLKAIDWDDVCWNEDHDWLKPDN